MSTSRIANRYSKALRELAVEKGVGDEVLADMQYIGEVAKEQEFKALLNSPIIDKRKKNSALLAVFESKVNPLTMQFLTWVTKRGRESVLSDMVRAYEDQYNADKKITKVHLTTAVELDDDSVEKIIGKLKAHMGDKDRTYEIIKHLDPQILGGFVLKYGDQLYDASLKNTLDEMRKALKDN